MLAEGRLRAGPALHGRLHSCGGITPLVGVKTLDEGPALIRDVSFYKALFDPVHRSGNSSFPVQPSVASDSPALKSIHNLPAIRTTAPRQSTVQRIGGARFLGPI